MNKAQRRAALLASVKPTGDLSGQGQGDLSGQGQGDTGQGQGDTGQGQGDTGQGDTGQGQGDLSGQGQGDTGQGQGDTGQGDTGQGDTGQGDTGQGATSGQGQGDPSGQGQGDTGQGQGDTGQGDTGQGQGDLSGQGQGDTGQGQGDTGQGDTGQGDTGQGDTGQGATSGQGQGDPSGQGQGDTGQGATSGQGQGQGQGATLSRGDELRAAGVTIGVLPPGKPEPAPALSPDYASMTAGQKAAYTRRMNKAGGGSTLPPLASTSTGPRATSTDARAVGTVVELLIQTEGTDRISLSFRAFGADGKHNRRGLAEGERSLPELRWSAVPSFSDNSELAAFDTCTLSAYRIGVLELERAIPLMRRVDRMLAVARDESEDLSLAFVASTLAAHFRVDRVTCRASDGSETQHKRGAAYVCAHRASEALLAAQPKPEPVPAAA